MSKWFCSCRCSQISPDIWFYGVDFLKIPRQNLGFDNIAQMYRAISLFETFQCYTAEPRWDVIRAADGGFRAADGGRFCALGESGMRLGIGGVLSRIERIKEMGCTQILHIISSGGGGVFVDVDGVVVVFRVVGCVVVVCVV